MTDQIAQDDHGWYFNPATGQVEQGQISPWTDRMGPYPTREDASRALATVRERNAAWDAQDEEWNG